MTSLISSLSWICNESWLLSKRDQWVVFFPTWKDSLLWLSGLYGEHGKNYLVSSPHLYLPDAKLMRSLFVPQFSRHDNDIESNSRVFFIWPEWRVHTSAAGTLVCCSLSFSIALIQLLDRMSAMTSRGLPVSKPSANEVIMLSSLLNK